MEFRKKYRYVINFVYYTFIVVLIYLLLQYGLGLIAPFVAAFIIAFILKTPARFVAVKTRIPYKLVAMVFVLLFYGTIGILIVLLGLKMFSIFTDLVIRLPFIYEYQVMPALLSLFDDIELQIYELDPTLQTVLNAYFRQFTQSMGESISSFSVSLLTSVSGLASSLPIFFIKLLMMVISSFFIAIDYDMVVGFVMRQFSPRGRELILKIKEYIVGVLFKYITSYLLIMTITFVELSIGFTILGISRAILVALLIAIFDVLPVLGTGGIMIPWTLFEVIRGNYSLAIGLFIIYVFVTIVRNVIEPRIVGKRIGLHPIVTLMAMFVGAQLFGVIGLFGFPITLALLRYLDRTGTINLFK
ncbi:MAG: sporulation integral membrane protein YtvI [Anaerovoracaceae bacterium]